MPVSFLPANATGDVMTPAKIPPKETPPSNGNGNGKVDNCWALGAVVIKEVLKSCGIIGIVVAVLLAMVGVIFWGLATVGQVWMEDYLQDAKATRDQNQRLVDSQTKALSDLTTELKEISGEFTATREFEAEVRVEHRQQTELLQDMAKEFKAVSEAMQGVPVQRQKELDLLDSIRKSLEECLKKNDT